jgi:hypothetical protein
MGKSDMAQTALTADVKPKDSRRRKRSCKQLKQDTEAELRWNVSLGSVFAHNINV